MSSADPGAGATATTATDDRQQALLEDLTTKLGDAVVGSHIRSGDLWVRVDRSAWSKAADVLRNQLAMDYFCYLSGLDWMVNKDLSGEKVWDPEGGAALEEEDAERSLSEPVPPDEWGPAI